MNSLNMDTLFDDLLVAAIMSATGADELTAKFMLAMSRGTVSGDIEIEGQDFQGTPFLRRDEAEAAPSIVFAPPSWSWRIATGTHASTPSTIQLSFSKDYEESV